MVLLLMRLMKLTCLWYEKALVSLHDPQALLHSGSLQLWKYHTLMVLGAGMGSPGQWAQHQT